MIDKFLDYLRYELNRASLTIEAYRLDLSQFVEWLSFKEVDKINFESITSADIRAWMLSLSKAGVSGRTLRRKVISLRAFFRWLLKKGIITVSPLEAIPLPKIPKPLPDQIKPEEIENAINDMSPNDSESSPLDSLIVELLYTLGIRRAELVGINDEDISYQKGEMKVTGKRSKQRVIPVPENLLRKIKEWQEWRNINEEKPLDSTPLLISKGKRITPDKVYRIVHKSLSGATARKKSPHALRHSFASGMLNGGAEIDSVREFLGHSSLATTQIYTHISLKDIKRAYNNAHPRSTKK